MREDPSDQPCGKRPAWAGKEAHAEPDAKWKDISPPISLIGQIIPTYILFTVDNSSPSISAIPQKEPITCSLQRNTGRKQPDSRRC
jgi:hypothetical protein